MPDLPREGAAHEKVLHCLWLLVAKGTNVIMREVVSCQMVYCPALLLHRKPYEELDAERRPRLPGKIPVGIFASPKKEGLVT